MFDIGPIPECVTQHYRDDRERWRWHCLTCDDGSNKRQRHRGGHKLESDALCGARMHARDAYRNRVARAQSAAWKVEVYSTQDPERWQALILWAWPNMKFRQDVPMQELMEFFQSKGN